MNIFEFDGEEFDKKLDEIFSNTDKEMLKKELIECGLEIMQLTYNVKKKMGKIEDSSYFVIESQQLELNEEPTTINLENNFMSEEGENEEWMEELVLAA